MQAMLKYINRKHSSSKYSMNCEDYAQSWSFLLKFPVIAHVIFMLWFNQKWESYSVFGLFRYKGTVSIIISWIYKVLQHLKIAFASVLLEELHNVAEKLMPVPYVFPFFYS